MRTSPHAIDSMPAPSDSDAWATPAPRPGSVVSTNTYRHTFVAVCPSDGDSIIYRLEIQTAEVIMVEHIRLATTLIKKGYHEQIADQLHQRFGGEQRMVATHQGVEIETLRSARA